MGYAYPSYDSYSSAENIFGSLGALAGGILIFLILLLVFLFAFLVLAVIFQGIGIMKMHQNLGLKHGWFAFIPVLNIYAFGKVAEQYVKSDGSKSAKFSKILLIGQIVNLISTSFSLFVSLITAIGDEAAWSTNIMATILLSSFFISLLQLGIGIALSVVLYVAMWRMFAIFSQNPTLNLIICIFISFVQPFIIFAIRNNEPMHIEKAVSKTEILQETNI